MPIPDLLNRGGREFHNWSGYDLIHLGEGGFDIKVSSYDSKPTEELR